MLVGGNFTTGRFASGRFFEGRFADGGAAKIITLAEGGALPAMSRLYDGQAVDDVPGYSTMVSAGNFASSKGNIVDPPDVTFQGDAVAADDPLVEGETAGFTVTPEDDADPVNSRAFVAAPITVEYKVRQEATEGNQANIDINDIVGDAVALGDIVVADAGAYNATYTGITAGDLRNGPYNWGASNSAGLPAISGVAETGQTLTVDVGLWTSSDDTALAFTYQWQRDGVNIGSATNSTYVLQAADEGTDITCEVTGTDTNDSTTAETAALSIPGSGFAVVEVLVNDYTASTGTITDTVPAGAADATKEVFLVLAYGQASAGTLTATLGGAAPDAEEVANTAYNSTIIRILRWDVPAGGDLALAMSLTANWAGVTYRAFTAVNRTTTTPKNANNASYAALDLSNAVNSGARIIGAAAMGSNGTTGAFSYVGLTEDYYNASHLGNRDQALFSATAGSTETRTMTVTPTNDGSGQVAAALLILE